MEHVAVEAPIDAVRASAYTIPTDKPETGGTYTWDSTTIVAVEVLAAGRTGLGYSYTHRIVAPLVTETLGKTVRCLDPFDPPAAWRAMSVAVRNLGRDGLAATAISALDTAIWDLKAKLLAVPLTSLLAWCA